MSEFELLEQNFAEYQRLLASVQHDCEDEAGRELLVRYMSEELEWTSQGARAVVSLVNQYGAFVLRNALALALALGKQDGELGF